MASNRNSIPLMLIRYSFLFIISLMLSFGLDIIYFIISYPTLYSSFFILRLFYPALLVVKDFAIFVQGSYIYLIPACIASAAYFLLLILNLSTPMPLKQRINSVVFLVLSFFIINVTRIIVFTMLVVSGFSHVDIAHKLTWYFGSTVLVVTIWIVNIKLFNIKNIPFYSDAIKIISLTKKKNR